MSKLSRTTSHSHNTQHTFHQHKHSVELGEIQERGQPHPLKEFLVGAVERVGPFDASSYNYHRWNIVVIIFVLWNALSIPIRVGFDDLWSEKYHWAHVMFLFVDYVGDLCFVADIFVNFRTSYMDHGIVHRETRKMAMYYLRGNFKWDLLASIDLGLIRWSIALHALLRVNRLIRMKKVLEYFSMWELNTKHSHGVSLIKLVAGIALYLHWIGCLYIAISYHYGFGSSEWEPPKEFEHSSFWSLYLYGFFWAVRVVTGQGGEVKPPGNDWERLFTMLNSLLALMIAGYIIGSIVDIISSMNAVAEEFRLKMSNINLYMNNKKLPYTLTDKIRNYYKHLWSRQGGIDDMEVLTELPTRLRTEVSLQINGDIISKVPFFKDCNPGFINSLVSLLRPQIYIPGDEIVSVGDVGTEMYFISQGEVEVVVGTKVVSTLGEGGFFGEIALLFESKRTATIRAKTYCDISTLMKSDLDKCLKSFPEQKAIITQMAQLRMSKDSLREIIKTDVLFQDVKPHEEFVTELQKFFKPKHVAAGDIIYAAGDKSDSMLFIGLGTITFITPTGRVLKELKIGSNIKEGCFFGDVEFLLNQPRGNTCRAADACTILELSREDFDAVIQRFPPNVRQSIEHVVAVKERAEEIKMSKTLRRRQQQQLKEKKAKEFQESLAELLEESKTAPKQDVTAAIKLLLDMLKDSQRGLATTEKGTEATFKGLTLSQLEDAKKAFKEFDLDGNGVIDKDEFFTLMQQLNPQMPKLLLKRIADLHFQALDKDGSEGIDQDEFLVVYSDLLNEYQPE